MALKVVGSNPTVRPKNIINAYLAELVDAIDLKFIPYLGCWFKSNSEQTRNIAKWLRHSFLIRTFEGSNPSISIYNKNSLPVYPKCAIAILEF